MAKDKKVMNYRVLLIGLFCLLNLTLPCFAKEWRNIFPLKTTRAEVLKLLGEPERDEEIKDEKFKVADGTVKIRWKRADCFTEEVFIGEQSLKPDFLVYQITFIPKEPLTLNSIESEKSSAVNNDSEIRGNVKEEVRAVYKKWMLNDVDCLIGSDNTVCSIMNMTNGFGYSTSNEGVTALYYLPAKKEATDWMEKLQPCAVEQN